MNIWYSAYDLSYSEYQIFFVLPSYRKGWVSISLLRTARE